MLHRVRGRERNWEKDEEELSARRRNGRKRGARPYLSVIALLSKSVTIGSRNKRRQLEYKMKVGKRSQ